MLVILPTPEMQCREGVQAPPPPGLPARWTPLRWHKTQHEMWVSTARTKLVAAGRASGKTELSKRRIVLALATDVPGCDKPLYFVAAPTHDQTKRVWWEDLKALTPPRWIDKISETETSIRTVFGSVLYLTGLDKPQRIEGNQYCGGVVDESSDVRPGAVSRSIRPALTQYKGWLQRIGVPKRFGVGAAEFRAACEAAATCDNPSAQFFGWPSSTVLTPEEIIEAQQDTSTDDFEEQYNAKWLDAAGALFSSFSADETVRPCAYDPARRVYVSCDFNVNPMAWVMAHKTVDGALEVFDELWLRNTNTVKALDVLWGRYSNHGKGWVFTGDASSRARKTSASASDYILIYNDERFKRAGREVHMGSSNPAIVDRVAATNRLLCDATGRRRLHVDPRCPHLLDDLRLRSSVSGSGDLTHMTDALGYLVWALYPLQPEQQSQELRQVG